jgi:rubredoxin
MDRYVCSICGETYNPKEGLPQYGIDPGILFEDLPDDWFCPCAELKSSILKKKSKLERPDSCPAETNQYV